MYVQRKCTAVRFHFALAWWLGTAFSSVPNPIQSDALCSRCYWSHHLECVRIIVCASYRSQSHCVISAYSYGCIDDLKPIKFSTNIHKASVRQSSDFKKSQKRLFRDLCFTKSLVWIGSRRKINV